MNDLAIIIPAYKPDFLDATLKSFQNQSDRRFHIYIADDCSPHDLYSIVSQYEADLPITYHRFESNLGQKSLVGHWNRAIALAKNEPWIWLFSDDDVVEERCVESFYKAIKSHPDDELFHFDLNVMDSRNNGKKESMTPYPEKLTAGDYLEAKLRGRLVSYVVEFVFSRELFTRVGGFWEFDLAWGSDFITWLRMAANSAGGIVTVKSESSKVIWRRSELNISPDRSYPIVKRKLRAWIDNAVVIKYELKKYPQKYFPLKYSYRWLRFPIGEIWRHRKYIKRIDVVGLTIEYCKKVIFSG